MKSRATHNRRGLAATVAVSALMLVAACSGGSGGRETEETVLQETTTAGTGPIDVLKWALPQGEPTSLDPAKVGDYSPSTVEENVCESLLGIDEQFNVQPDLASKWEYVDDTTIVFTLRDDAVFSDGTPLTAEDVVFSLERHTDPEVGSFWGSAFESVTSIEATAPLEVTVKLTRPDSLFLATMATPGGSISQQAFVEKAGASYGTAKGGLMCTGPYKLDEWVPGKSITLSVNEEYTNPELQPKAATVEFSFVTDPSTLTTALSAGEFDGAYELPQSTSETLGKQDGGTVFHGPSTQMVQLAPTENDGPLSDPAIRTALDLAIDKAGLAQTIYGGNAEPLRSFVPPVMWGTGDDRGVYEAGYGELDDTTSPDVDEAKRLVAQADLADNSFSVGTAAGDETSIQTLTFIQAAAKDVGLDMSIEQFQPVELSTMFYDPTTRAAVDALYAQGYSEIAYPLGYASYFVLPGGLFNWIGYEDPEVTDLMGQARAATDPAEAAELFVQAQALFVTERMSIPIVSPSERLYMRDGISGAPASFAYIGMPWAAMIGATE